MADDSRWDWLAVALTSLTVALGVQGLRYFLPLIVYTFSSLPFEPGYIAQGLFAVGAFVVGGALAGVLWAGLGPRRALAVTAGGTGLARLAAQVVPGTRADLWLMTAGTLLFLSSLPVSLGVARGRGRAGGTGLGLGIVLGLALDSGLHGLWRTYDLAWQTDIGSHLVVAALVGGQLYALARALPPANFTPGPEAGGGASLAYAAIGPFLFLQLLEFQNIARLTTFIETVQPLRAPAGAFAMVVVANAFSTAMVVWIAARGRPKWGRGWLASVVAGLLMVGAASLTPGNPQGMTAGLALLNVIGVVVGGTLAATMLTLILIRLCEGDRGTGLWRTTAGSALGGLLFVVPAFLYYIAYDIRLPFSNEAIPPIAAAVLALAAILAGRRDATAGGLALDWRPALGATALLALPLVMLALTPLPATRQGEGGPLRVVDYNLHMGFDAHGDLGMEALAEVMDGADVVVLQEVSRGWVINGSLDMLGWLSHRLGMRYVFAPAADPVWGNAILSRYPLQAVQVGALPRGPVAMKRGYVSVDVDYGADATVRVIGTHLHHVEGDTAVRIPQVDAVVEAWDGTQRTLIMGDMNARPGEADVIRYTEAGLIDVYAETGSEDSLTFSSDDPYELIDWIFASPDVRFLDFEIPQTTASDHLPLVTTVEIP